MRVPLLLMRHGQTDGNAERRYVGHTRDGLNAVGRGQAASLAARLAQRRVGAVVSSDLPRAMETAVPIAAAHGLTARPDTRLRELDFGAMTGMTAEEVEARWPGHLAKWWREPETVSPPGGETLASLRERVMACLAEVAEDLARAEAERLASAAGDAPGREAPAVVVVTHGGPIRAVVSALRDMALWDVEVDYETVWELAWEAGLIV